MKYSDKEKEIFTKIRHFFLERSKGNYREAAKTVESLGITRIEISLNKMRICLRRPGLLIGKKGECIDALSKYLEDDALQIIIEEDGLVDYLTPVDYSDF